MFTASSPWLKFAAAHAWTNQMSEEFYGQVRRLGQTDKKYVWRRQGEAFKPTNAVPFLKHGAGSIMLWY